MKQQNFKKWNSVCLNIHILFTFLLFSLRNKQKPWILIVRRHTISEEKKNWKKKPEDLNHTEETLILCFKEHVKFVDTYLDSSDDP